MIKPIRMPANQPADRFYRGGEKIRAFRGEAAEGTHVPEDWVASSTSLFGDPRTGQSALPDGRRLIDAVRANPEAWLGRDHLGAYGPDPMLLVKLLDAGERLPVHLHPDGEFAGRHIGTDHGKAEAWYILEGGNVFLGFKRQVSRSELDRWVQAQDINAMLGAMHELSVSPGDSVFVPPGLPHAIGPGIFLVEVQEPEDLSILLEWDNFAIDGSTDGHLGVGFDTALAAADRRNWSAEKIESLVVRHESGVGTLAEASRPYFRAENLRVDSTARFDAGFGILVITAGQGRLDGDGFSMELTRGDTVLLAHASGSLTVSGTLELVRCMPPAADASPAGKVEASAG